MRIDFDSNVGHVENVPKSRHAENVRHCFFSLDPSNPSSHAPKSQGRVGEEDVMRRVVIGRVNRSRAGAHAEQRVETRPNECAG